MFRKLTRIRTKLSLLQLLATAISTFIACALLVAFWLYFGLQSLQDDLATTAEALGNNSRAAILFNSPADATTILETLKSKTSISLAGIITEQEALFAGYSRDHASIDRPALPNGPYPVHRLNWSAAETFTEIILDGERVGIFYLKDDLSRIRESLYPLLLILPFVLITALILTHTFLLKIQKQITKPILSLAETARRVSQGSNYSLRAREESADEIGQLTEAFNSMLDMVETHSQQLQESESRYRGLLTATPLPVFVLQNEVMMYLNPAAASLLGEEDLEKLIGESIRPHLCNDKDNETDLFLSQELQNNRHVQHRMMNFCLTGRRKSVETSSINTDFDGNPSQLVLCVDVTERLKIEKQLEAHRTKLEEMVEHRTSALKKAQGKLLVQERLATLGQLTATVSHELRNPLGTISNALFNLSFALEANEPEVVQTSLRITERSIVRCDRIINELLDYSRGGTLDLGPVAFDDFLKETLEELDWPKEITLIQKLRSSVITEIDAERLRRVIVNLTTNAQQSLDEISREDKTITVSTVIEKDHLLVTVEDNGPGIPEALSEKIFEPLFSTKNFGVGLGMTIVKDIVEMHGGVIQLHRSKAEEGCCFVFRLPLKRPSLEEIQDVKR